MGGMSILLNKKIKKLFVLYNFKSLILFLKPYNFYLKNCFLSFILLSFILSTIFASKEKYYFFLKEYFVPYELRHV